MASLILLFPQPLGPTTATIPGLNSNAVRRKNDLKPCISIRSSVNIHLSGVHWVSFPGGAFPLPLRRRILAENQGCVKDPTQDLVEACGRSHKELWGRKEGKRLK